MYVRRKAKAEIIIKYAILERYMYQDKTTQKLHLNALMIYLSKKLHLPTLTKYFKATRGCCTQISTAKCIMVAFSDTCKH